MPIKGVSLTAVVVWLERRPLIGYGTTLTRYSR